ncbi:acyltransferase family protein, partial [Mycobacterium sp.]|uniref:acyltransferase family protein n=1 Tax=Mycobacterium sp. TaxID=1785 RepID=UPI002D8C86CF|nr:acyltransferase [Mycobacterium sp.]
MATARRFAGAVPETSVVTPARVRIRGLDGARGLAAVGVLIAHVADYYPAESSISARITALVGVSLIFFFVLSGFLLFLPYVRALTESESPKLPNTKYYATQRFARVFPAYIVILLITNYVLQTAYVSNPMLYPFGSGGGTGMITDPGQLFANLTLVQTYIPEYFQTGLNPSWSLSMEFAFYACLPLLCLVIFAARRRLSFGAYKLAVIAVIVLVVMGFVGKLLAPVLIPDYDTMNPWLTNWGPNWGAVYLRSFPVNADNYALGMLAAIVIVAMERRKLTERLSRRVRLYSALAIVPACALFVISLALRRQFETTALALLGALLILVIVAPSARGQDSMLANWFDIGPFRFLGRVSLSLCLWHFPIMLLLGSWGLMRIGS